MSEKEVTNWMRKHVKEHIDEFDKLDVTGLVEHWDDESGDGIETEDSDYNIAWDCGDIVAGLPAVMRGIEGTPE